MRLLITSDWQSTVSNLPQLQVVLEHILELIPKHKINAVVNLGDTKDAFNPCDIRVTNFLVSSTQKIVSRCPMYVLLGNHDRGNVHDSSASCLPWLAAAGAKVFDAPTVQFIPGVDGSGGKTCYFVPFMRDKDRLRLALNQTLKHNSKFPGALFFHEEIHGCSLNARVKSTGGVSTVELHPERYNLCIGGHIHYQQQVANNVWYCGSPFCHDFGEANQVKGFLLVDIDKTVKVTPILSRVPGWYDPTLPGFPKVSSWREGTQIRVHSTDNSSTGIEKARKQAEKVYPGATIHVVSTPTVDVIEAEGEPIGETDVELLQHYLKQTVDPKQAGAMLAYLQTRVQGKFALGIKGFQPESVVVKEMLCFKEAELQLNKPGLTLVTGVNRDWHEGQVSNGSGKTTLLSLLQIVLFGSTLKGQTHDQLRRNNATEPTVGTLVGKLVNGDSILIERGRKPGYLTVQVAGKDRTMGDANATQRLIEELTGLTLEVFTNSIYIGQQEISTLLWGTDKAKKELFGKFLGLERFIKAQESIRKDILACERRTVEIRGEAEVAESLALEQGAVLAGLQSKVPQVRKSVPVLFDTKKLQVLKVDIEQLHAWLDSDQYIFEKYMDYGHAADAKIEQLQAWLDKMDSDNCPLCGTKLKGGERERHEKEMKAEIKKQEVESDKWDKKQNENRAYRAKKLATLQGKKAELDVQNKLVQQAEMERRLWEQEKETFAQHQELIEKSKRRIKLLELRATVHQNYVAQLEKHLQFLQACLKVVSREGLPTYLCGQVCPRLNKIARQYSHLFTDGEINVAFHIEGGDLTLEIQNLHGGLGVHDQSAGELRLAALIAVLAFRKAFVNVPMLALDEPSEGMDAYNSGVFAKGLREIAREFGTVFLTTHSVPIISVLEPDHVLIVTKHNGVSMVEVQ